MTTLQRHRCLLPVVPWFQDHCFNGKTVLAAVEAMACLARTVDQEYPYLDVYTMQYGRFPKFLEIPLESAWIETIVELEPHQDGGVWARLQTRLQRKAFARTVNHCEICFGGRGGVRVKESSPDDGATPAPIWLDVGTIYRDLVPFGPAYRTLRDRLALYGDCARGWVQAPRVSMDQQLEPLGSPFPLDGAMHAACVHGQRVVDFIPFPVGFTGRTLVRPPQAGEYLRVLTQLRTVTAEELIYDLRLWDMQGVLVEEMTGLRMRDVTGGRMVPPAWLRQMEKP